MSDNSSIEWTDTTWNPVVGCTRVSEGCRHCYAETMTNRLAGMARADIKAGRKPGRKSHYLNVIKPNGKWNGVLEQVPEVLTDPFKWRTPRRVFVNSMSDLFHENVRFDYIDRVFAVMALTPQHTYQVLTKRPERMAEYLNTYSSPFLIARQMDCISVSRLMSETKREIRPIPECDGYFISNEGDVFTGSGSAMCIQCGQPLNGKDARAKFCGKTCRALEHWRRKNGKQNPRQITPKLTPLGFDVGEQGHRRVTIRKSGKRARELVHRLVLSTFDRAPVGDEQGCHRTGDPSINHIANLRWGSQSDNWDDRRRHGNGHSYGERRGVEVPIPWPLPNCWAGTSCENQKTADERIPHLLKCPAAVRFLSCEPLLESIDIRRGLSGHCNNCGRECSGYCEGESSHFRCGDEIADGLHWLIVGGESGPGARPYDFDWARGIINPCRAAGVPVFHKQVGTNPVFHCLGSPVSARGIATSVWGPIKDSKGGNPDEWPEDLRVRQFPTAKAEVPA